MMKCGELWCGDRERLNVRFEKELWKGFDRTEHSKMFNIFEIFWGMKQSHTISWFYVFSLLPSLSSSLLFFPSNSLKKSQTIPAIHTFLIFINTAAASTHKTKTKHHTFHTYNISYPIWESDHHTKKITEKMRQSVKLSFLAALSLTFISNFIAIPANVNLFVTSFLTIYVGSHRRLVQMEVRLFFIAKTSFFRS